MASRRIQTRQHSAVWKIAYADFVTAMMAFFLLMWLVNTTTPDQKRGIAEYFAPPQISESRSGNGGLFGGQSIASEGPKAGDGLPPIVVAPTMRPALQDMASPAPDAGTHEGSAARQARLFEAAEADLRQAMSELPDSDLLTPNIVFDRTEDGLDLQITLPTATPMFKSGKSQLTPAGQRLFTSLAPLLKIMPNPLIIAGHTAAGEAKSPLRLATHRALAVQDTLMLSGLEGDRVASVTGRGTNDPANPEIPADPMNARVSLTVLLENAALPPGYRLGNAAIH